jgi:hypothetical protein
MKIKQFTFILFVASASFCTAQNNGVRTIESKRTVLPENTEIVHVTKSQNASESAYFGFDNKIKEFCLNNEIPSGLPTKENYQNKETYRKSINLWLKENSSFVKPENINKEITN